MSTDDNTPPTVGTLAEYTEAPFERRTEWAREGNIVRITGEDADHYMVVNPNHIGDVLFDTERFTRLDTFTGVFGNGILTVSGDQWRAQRGAIQPAFVPEKIQSHAGKMRGTVRNVTGDINPGETLNSRELFTNLTMEVMLETLFGGADGDKETISEATEQITEWFLESATAGEVPPEVEEGLNTGLSELTSLIDSMVAGQDGDEDGGILSILVALGANSEPGYTEDRIRDEMVTLLFAAHETTALTLTYASYLLAGAPEVEQRLLTEVKKVVDGSVPEPSDLNQLAYTEQVVDEALRMYPPAHALFRVPTEEITLGDYTIPEGDVVHMPQWVVHRDERWWDDPTAFRPGRFDGESDRPPYCFFPFGVGPRRCIGENFARAEAKMALAAIWNQFSFERVTEEFEMHASLTAVPDRPIKLTPRQRS
jgi:cytochrome P450